MEKAIERRDFLAEILAESLNNANKEEYEAMKAEIESKQKIFKRIYPAHQGMGSTNNNFYHDRRKHWDRIDKLAARVRKHPAICTCRKCCQLEQLQSDYLDKYAEYGDDYFDDF